MVKLAHRDKTRAPIQIGVGTNIGAPTQTSQGDLILGKVDPTVKGFLGGEKDYPPEPLLSLQHLIEES